MTDKLEKGHKVESPLAAENKNQPSNWLDEPEHKNGTPRPTSSR